MGCVIKSGIYSRTLWEILERQSCFRNYGLHFSYKKLSFRESLWLMSLSLRWNLKRFPRWNIFQWQAGEWGRSIRLINYVHWVPLGKSLSLKIWCIYCSFVLTMEWNEVWLKTTPQRLPHCYYFHAPTLKSSLETNCLSLCQFDMLTRINLHQALHILWQQ